MRKPADLLGELSALFREELHIDVPAPDADLIDGGLLDSLQLVQLLMSIEERLGTHIALDEIDLEDLRTLERIARLLERIAARLAPAPPLLERA